VALGAQDRVVLVGDEGAERECGAAEQGHSGHASPGDSWSETRAGDHPLMPAPRSEGRKCFWNRQKRTTTGRARAQAPARMTPLGLASARAAFEMKFASATARGWIEASFVMRKGQRNSFHGPIKVISTTVAIAGFTIGIATDHSTRSSLAPSIRAASKIDSGSARKNCRKMNTAVVLIRK